MGTARTRTMEPLNVAVHGQQHAAGPGPLSGTMQATLITQIGCGAWTTCLLLIGLVYCAAMALNGTMSGALLGFMASIGMIVLASCVLCNQKSEYCATTVFAGVSGTIALMQ